MVVVALEWLFRKIPAPKSSVLDLNAPHESVIGMRKTDRQGCDRISGISYKTAPRGKVRRQKGVVQKAQGNPPTHACTRVSNQVE